MKTFFRYFGLPMSLVILAAAYYIKIPAARNAIDARAPWVKGILGRFVQEPEVVVTAAPKPGPETADLQTPVPELAPPAPVIAIVPPTPPPATPRRVFNLEEIAANRAEWPAKLKLKKAVQFPAVANGKRVGFVLAPVGAEVKLISISGGKIGVEYQGGGAWLAAEETDMPARTTFPLPGN
jgi:hypothetical protein